MLRISSFEETHVSHTKSNKVYISMIYISIYVYIYMYISMINISICVYIYIYTYIWTNICQTQIHETLINVEYIYLCTYTYVYIYICKQILAKHKSIGHVYMYNIYIHIRIHIYIYAYKQKKLSYNEEQVKYVCMKCIYYIRIYVYMYTYNQTCVIQRAIGHVYMYDMYIYIGIHICIYTNKPLSYKEQ